MITLRRAAGLAVAAVAAVSLVAGCSDDVELRAVPEAGSSATESSTSPSSSRTTTSAPTTSESPSASDLDLEIDAEIGDCVLLGGTVDDATIEEATCGSDDSNYLVVDIVTTSDECNSDQSYYESIRGNELGALCLDIDWQVDGCMDLGGEDPKRIDCSETAIEGEKVTEILEGTTDVNECSISDSGFVYEEREMVVCADSF
ncbi:hypothetical protein HCA61_25235 [Rhodococcus sp. HNM0563]|uniref:LppU family putative lipoprotein n=1 Tax=Rhodococcus sp. HNM0563 TaxID=2716339 RepID=UPI001469ED79|nr:hypothetical protein [Rhodococcus sp. HNM0563]NLU65536.1 hypothetical protein [Rhodococcus sp. HNM0563]